MKIKYIFTLLLLLSPTIFTHSNNTYINFNRKNLIYTKNKNETHTNEVTLLKQINFQVPFYLKSYVKNSILYTYHTKYKDKLVVANALYFSPKKINNNNNYIIIFAHGTLGVNKQCGIETNLGLITQYFFIKSLLKEGYNVIAPNYRGIGESNVDNLYLNAQDSAEDVLNATLALMTQNYITQNNKIILWGVSQGGVATQRAAEIAYFYAPKLNIVGSIQNSPPLNIVIPYNKFKKEDLNTLQYLLLPFLVSAVVRSNDGISFNDYYQSSYLKENEKGETFGCLNFFNNFLISNPLTLKPTQKGAKAMEEYLTKQIAPKYKTDIPLLLIRGKQDKISQISNKNVADNYLKLFCKNGLIISEIVRNGGHFKLKDIQYSLQWIKDRFAGQPPKNSCEQLKT